MSLGNKCSLLFFLQTSLSLYVLYVYMYTLYKMLSFLEKTPAKGYFNLVTF